MNTVLYPGTFDPITNGHIDIIDRSSRIFDRLVITVALNSAKQTMFTADEREELIGAALRERLPDRGNIEVVQIGGLLADFARSVNAVAVVRGLRTLGDFEYEMQMALMNRRLYGGLSTFFMAADERYIHLNSTIIREIARYGADVTEMVPDCIAAALKSKVASVG